MIIFPVVGSTPATGFIFGLAAQVAFKGKRSVDRMSLASANAQYTTKNQFMLMVKNNVYFNSNKIFLSGDWRWLIYSQTTYGLGTNSPGDLIKYNYAVNGWNTSEDSLAQPMLFDYIKLHQTSSWSINENIFLGGGIHYDSYFDIVDQKLDTTIKRYTSHYAYSIYKNFNTQKYITAGVSFNAVYDSRDNLVNPYRGIFANFNYRFNPSGPGNAAQSQMAYLEFRYYQPLSKKDHRHLIALWTYANILTAGELPYLMLPITAGDQRNRSSRGYSQGRYRGENMIYAEVEYRFPISPCTKILGGVAFVNINTTDNLTAVTYQNIYYPKVKLFEYVKPAGGIGLRIMVDKQSRTNLQIDYAMGNGSSGFYLGATETF